MRIDRLIQKHWQTAGEEKKSSLQYKIEQRPTSKYLGFIPMGRFSLLFPQ